MNFIWRRNRRRKFVVVLAAFGALALPISSSATTAGPSNPTLNQLTGFLTSTVRLSHVPVLANTIPPFNAAPSNLFGQVPAACYSPDFVHWVPRNPLKTCSFGDTKAARTILLFGDDNAVQWLPPLEQLAIQYKWRVVFIGKAKCSPWLYGSSLNRPNCRRFVNQEISFANSLHAGVIIPIGAKIAWRGTKFSSIKHMKTEMGKTLDALVPSHSRVVLFETIPQFNSGYTTASPLTCVRQPSGLRACESVIHNFLLNNTAGRAIWETSTQRGLFVLPMRQFFCTTNRCTLWVSTPAGTWLVYSDRTHMTSDFSLFLTESLDEYLAPVLH